MIELVHFPWSPYCLVIRRILEFSGAPHKLTEIPPSDRSLVWRLTRQRYYQVPIVRDGRSVVFETGDNSQVIAKYLESKLRLGLFPRPWEGIQAILWRFIDNDVEGLTFRLNDACYQDFVPASEQLPYLRYKERKFGRGCLAQWAEQRKELLGELTSRLEPFEQMLRDHSFLLDDQPRFVDFNLWGMLANFLYSGHYTLPKAHSRLRRWHARMTKVRLSSPTLRREKLHS